MAKPVNNHLDELLQGQEDGQGNTDLHGQTKNTAGNPYGNKVMKQGAKPNPNVENTAAFVEFKIQCGKLSEDNYYIFVDYDDKNYIFTLGYVLEFLSQNFRSLLKSSVEKYFLKQELMFSASMKLQDVINRIMNITGENIDVKNLVVREQATQQQTLEPSTLCKGLP